MRNVLHKVSERIETEEQSALREIMHAENHRLIAYDMPDAPIGHHWEDTTHITFGVVTAGLTLTKLRFEANAFTGREPKETRTNFDPVSLDSVSGRVSSNSMANVATQFPTATSRAQRR